MLKAKKKDSESKSKLETVYKDPERVVVEKASDGSLTKKVVKIPTAAPKKPRDKKAEYSATIEKVDGVDVHSFGLVDIWRLEKKGEWHGIPRQWQEDHYRVKSLKRDRTGEQYQYVKVEAIVDESFKLLNKNIYSEYIKKVGALKDDRY